MVKGPLSSLYGPDAIGGVVQIFTRASARPRLFASGAATAPTPTGASRAGFTAIEGETTVSFSAGGRNVDAPSATNERAYCHDPDRDPYDNGFANLKVVGRLANGETLTLTGFVSQGARTSTAAPTPGRSPTTATCRRSPAPTSSRR